MAPHRPWIVQARINDFYLPIQKEIENYSHLKGLYHEFFSFHGGLSAYSV